MIERTLRNDLSEISNDKWSYILTYIYRNGFIEINSIFNLNKKDGKEMSPVVIGQCNHCHVLGHMTHTAYSERIWNQLQKTFPKFLSVDGYCQECDDLLDLMVLPSA